MKNSLISALVTGGLSAALLTALTTSPLAFERDHAAHEHGHAKLMLAQEGNELHIRLESPAMNIVGFEHQASTDADKARLKKAVETLEQGETLFRINAEAACSPEHFELKSELLAEHEQHDEHKEHHDDHDDHHDHHNDGHHDDHHEEQHDHHDEHDHGSEEAHSDFHVSYHFECEQMAQLSSLQVGLFEYFPAMEEVEAQIITDKSQRLIELDAQNAGITF